MRFLCCFFASKRWILAQKSRILAQKSRILWSTVGTVDIFNHGQSFFGARNGDRENKYSTWYFRQFSPFLLRFHRFCTVFPLKTSNVLEDYCDFEAHVAENKVSFMLKMKPFFARESGSCARTWWIFHLKMLDFVMKTLKFEKKTNSPAGWSCTRTSASFSRSVFLHLNEGSALEKRGILRLKIIGLFQSHVCKLSECTNHSIMQVGFLLISLIFHWFFLDSSLIFLIFHWFSYIDFSIFNWFFMEFRRSSGVRLSSTCSGRNIFTSLNSYFSRKMGLNYVLMFPGVGTFCVRTC